MSKAMKKAPGAPSKTLFTRVKPEDAARIEAIAQAARVTVGEYLRWVLEDIVAGKYKPAHLR